MAGDPPSGLWHVPWCWAPNRIDAGSEETRAETDAHAAAKSASCAFHEPIRVGVAGAEYRRHGD
jgi:hypothetical protein